MQETVKNIKKDVNDMEEKVEKAEFALQALNSRNAVSRRYENCLLIAVVVLATLLIMSVVGNVCAILWLIETDYVEETVTTETSYDTSMEGAYNFYDSDGNLVNSDLSLEEMQELIDLNNGEDN